MAQEPEPESVNIQMISIVNHLFTPAQISPDRRYQVYRWYPASGKCNNVQKGLVDYLPFPPPDDIKTISPGSGWGPVTKEAVSDLWLHLAYLAISELSSELAGLPPCSTRWIWAIKDTTNREGREGRWPDAGPVFTVCTRVILSPGVTYLHLFWEDRGCLGVLLSGSNNLLQLSSLAYDQYDKPELLRAAS